MSTWMTRALIPALLTTLVSLPAAAALKEGDVAPDFKLQASLDGKAFRYALKDELKKGPVVVYFYPSAYTGGCNAQAHSFAVNAEKFAAAGASIIGVSLDSIARLNKFGRPGVLRRQGGRGLGPAGLGLQGLRADRDRARGPQGHPW